jgi:multiple sugar transport system ATP-binding protein
MGQVALRGVFKSFENTEVIRGIDLEVRDGEFMVFVGPSGCGKSTTLRMIAGLESISAGEISIDGVRANDLPPAKRGAAMVFQSYALYPHMTVAENMGFALKMAGESRAKRDEQVMRAAEILDIIDLLKRFPKELSGGQRQRVAIGRAIVRKPKVFLFDEPLSNLDAALRVNMRVELSKLHKTLGTTMVYVTHDQVEAMTMGDRIAVFNKGRVEQLGAPMDLYHRPVNEFVAGFIGTPRINFVSQPLPGNAASDHSALWQALTALVGGGVQRDVQRIGIRPEHIGLGLRNQGLCGTVELTENLGDSSTVYLRVDGIADLLVAKVAGGDVSYHLGQKVGLNVIASRAMGFDKNTFMLA